jgi:D-alanyl-D-alanine carboxypeptidase
VVSGLLFTIGAFYYAQVFSYQMPVTPVSSDIVFRVASGSVPVLSVSSYLIFDTETGAVLASQTPDEVYPIASVTKLFTATAILENFNPESTTTITWSDLSAEGEAGRLELDQVYTYRELLFPLLLESSNDAALTLEHATGGLAPVLAAVARKYGAEHAQFADASGLSADNTASARDLMHFTRAVSKKYPLIFDITTLPQYLGTYTGWLNNNPVSATDAYRGGKHGYTPEANRTIIALFSEQVGTGERTIGYIILGSDNLATDVELLRKFIASSVEYR